MRHGANIDPPNRFERIHRETDLEHVEWDDEFLRQLDNKPIEYVEDASQSIVSENQSPDIPFRYSVNPYRGCVHGCSYCYARPTHEYLGFNSGREFETKIVVKKNAAALLRTFLAKPKWVPQTIVFSGVTDCYQPAEREFQLTRKCLEVAADCGLPVGIITKNALVVRDRDLLQKLASKNLVSVYLSITTLEPGLARRMEPRTSIPTARLRAIRELSEAGIPVGVMVAPVIPGLNDEEIPRILEVAADAGAKAANYITLRLPLSVEEIFLQWLREHEPLKAERVESRIRAVRQGELSSSEFGERMSGTGQIAEQISQLVTVYRRRYKLDIRLPRLSTEHFVPPCPNGQRQLF